MNHLIEKPWEFSDEGKTTQHMGERHSLGFKVRLMHAVIKGNAGAHRLYSSMEERGLDTLLLIVPCLIALPFL
ncbi:hypothetical protein [Vibrio sp. HN007]|uniref:hypothetical protein n=1 Tax=Vibrio iocasae TaxID=3098914 RepID=UPI0035D520D3